MGRIPYSYSFPPPFLEAVFYHTEDKACFFFKANTFQPELSSPFFGLLFLPSSGREDLVGLHGVDLLERY